MILTDREWLRFVTFGIVVGAVLGATYTGALGLRGHPPQWAIAAGVIGPGILAAIVHVALRVIIDRATDPVSTDATTDTDADTDTDFTDS